jgi:hypothetical protein
MALEIDVYQLLKSFAVRNKKTSIEYQSFAQAIQRQARTYDQNQPLYRDLSLHPDAILIPKLFQLSVDKRISLQSVGNRIDLIHLPESFTELVYAEYRRMEENPDIPFPDENSLRLYVPPEWIQAVSVESDLPSLLEFEGDRPVPLYRIMFPEGIKPILILSVAVGDKLLEYAVLKIRNYLRKGSNKDFMHQRLVGVFTGKESQLKESFTTIVIRPFDIVAEMRQGSSDFLFSFWAYLTSSVRKDLEGKTDPTPDDTAAWQASYLVDVYNNHYRSKSQRDQERDSAFKSLMVQLRKPPYVFTMDDVMEFRDGQAHPLLGKYTREELEQWMKQKTTEAVAGAMPEILAIGSVQGAGRLIAKDKLLPYLVKALKDARAVVKASVTNEWREILADFGSVIAMEDNAAFATDLERRMAVHAPLLSAILSTALAPLVYQEFRGEATEDLDRCFGDNRVASYPVLLNLDRKHLLSDVRMLLPFWYTVPIISWFIALFRNRSRRKSMERAAAPPPPRLDSSGGRSGQTVNSRAMEFSEAAREAEKRLLPKGMSLEESLTSLNSRWNTLLDPVSKANLTEDINSLVRDFLRNALRSMRPSSFTRERIEAMAATLADRPNLLQIRNHTALEEYIKLYMIKVLKR